LNASNFKLDRFIKKTAYLSEKSMSRLFLFAWLTILSLFSCERVKSGQTQQAKLSIEKPSLIILGTAQDAGAPHAGCQKDCCKQRWNNPDFKKRVVCLGVIDPNSQKTFLFEATPDLPSQMYYLQELAVFSESNVPDGIFLTHAHIGHYTGLMHLGREALGSKGVPVFAMPEMKSFLESNGPWSQLVQLGNIALQPLKADSTFTITPNLNVTPFRVPHRDEYSETVAYKIEGPEKAALFIPDIDKWNKWERDIREEIKKVDYAFLDATFYKNGEIKGRDMSEIPHPFVEESMQLFTNLPEKEKQKVVFIHFNHTNPLLEKDSPEAAAVEQAGFKLAREGQIFEL